MRVGDNFTKVLNTHAIKIGGIAERQYKQQNFQHQNNIQLNFARWADGGTGNEFADMLVGRPARAVGRPAFRDRHLRRLQLRVLRPGLVEGEEELHAGVRRPRRQVVEQRRDKRASAASSCPSCTTGRRRFLIGPRTAPTASRTRPPAHVDNNLTDSRPLLFMPRVNFAWDLEGNGNTVFRGGGGIFFNRESGQRPVRDHQHPAELVRGRPRRRHVLRLRRRPGPELQHDRQIDPLANPSLLTPGEIDSVNPTTSTGRGCTRSAPRSRAASR